MSKYLLLTNEELAEIVENEGQSFRGGAQDYATSMALELRVSEDLRTTRM